MFSSREPATGVVCGPTRCHRCRTQLWMSWPGLRGEASTHGRWRETIASLNYAVPDSSGRATQCSHSRAVVSAKTPCVTKRAPRILSSYLRTSNYSSAHLTRMNDIVKVSSSASGSRGASRDASASVEENDEKHQVVERASGPDFTPTLLGRPEQTWRSFVCAATKSREHMFDATAPGFDGPAGCPTQSRIRFRRLWLRFFFPVCGEEKTKDARRRRRAYPDVKRVCQG